MDTEIAEVKEEIRKVEREIRNVEQEIRNVEQHLEHVEGQPTTGLKDADVAYWRRKEEQLRKEKEQLREKEDRLREEKLMLLKTSTSGIVRCPDTWISSSSRVPCSCNERLMIIVLCLLLGVDLVVFSFVH